MVRTPVIKSGKMQRSNQAILRAIYFGSQKESSGLSIDYANWLDSTLLRRGVLDRKKAVKQDQLQKAIGISTETVDLERFVFAAESYLLVRALRAIEICTGRSLASATDLPVPVGESIAYREHVLEVLDKECPNELQDGEALLRKLVLEPKEYLTDEFQEEFMDLVPRQVRHAIGSFYTPPWLARHLVRSVGYRHEEPESLLQSLIDPSCGSGVFLVAAAEEVRQAVAAGDLTPAQGLAIVQSKLHGSDIELIPCLLAIASLTISAKAIAELGSISPVQVATGVVNEDSLEVQKHQQPMDLIVGNPPWVNWEYMPQEYRLKHGPLWERLGIFDSSAKTMSFSKEDISALFVSHAISTRLADDGRFAFVLPESLFKSSRNHRGFRRFALHAEQHPYKVTMLEDFVDVRPFEGVANRTVVMFGRNGAGTEYPVPFRAWSKLTRSAQRTTGSEGLVGEFNEGVAQLGDEHDILSNWSTGLSEALEVHRRLDGDNAYRARTGLFTGGANAVFHVRPLTNSHAGMLTLENVTERAKRKVPQVQFDVEDKFVYPFLRGRDLKRWSARTEIGVLLPHTAETKMYPVSESKLKKESPRLHAYFEDFREILDERKGFSSWEKTFRDRGFYACQRVGDYTFSDWKVAWRYIASSFLASVIGPEEFSGMRAKPVIPNEKLMLIPCANEQEAHYLGGVLAASVVLDHIHSRMVSTQISPSIIARIAIPRFDPQDQRHQTIADLSRHGHQVITEGGSVGVSEIDALDSLVASIWGLSERASRSARERNPF